MGGAAGALRQNADLLEHNTDATRLDGLTRAIRAALTFGKFQVVDDASDAQGAECTTAVLRAAGQKHATAISVSRAIPEFGAAVFAVARTVADVPNPTANDIVSDAKVATCFWFYGWWGTAIQRDAFRSNKAAIAVAATVKTGRVKTSLLEELKGNCGGLNQGVWVVKDNSQKFMLKLVKGVNSFGMPTEGEKFFRILNEHPGISTDQTLSFPVKIIRLVSLGQGKLYELIVMRKAPGALLSEHIATMRSENRVQQLLQIFEQCGQFLAEFHACYDNKQHNDFQPSNIFYDPVTSRFTLIDLADMGPKIHEADVERFANALAFFRIAMDSNSILMPKDTLKLVIAGHEDVDPAM
eukprot:CAMPEP_0169114796 /NCGR_PEP_ID=MMETSP1015-20121227/28968_1 /TAXON_ID=342587 /ORGANISM="Karlodinium micrum, Strain CCMP2283" /LENGTH=353 /DNA_ID=CAMNT_0009177141 /DNA_START=213 /DNA_END=1278 /DNA_ORIENTATION=-